MQGSFSWSLNNKSSLEVRGATEICNFFLRKESSQEILLGLFQTPDTFWNCFEEKTVSQPLGLTAHEVATDKMIVDHKDSTLESIAKKEHNHKSFLEERGASLWDWLRLIRDHIGVNAHKMIVIKIALLYCHQLADKTTSSRAHCRTDDATLSIGEHFLNFYLQLKWLWKWNILWIGIDMGEFEVFVVGPRKFG